jgi:hypothetical protein
MAALLALAPVHSLPWYFGAIAFGIWAAAAAGFVILVKRRIRAKAERRRDERHGRPRRAPLADDVALGTGTEIEPRRSRPT